jgi:pimeloyl-ACP methyl ester carboxylesterase
MNSGIEEKTATVDGFHTRYVVAGAGPPLVLLHGLGENVHDWSWVLPELAEAHRVYAPDLLCSTTSVQSPADRARTFSTRFLATFLDALGIEQPVLVGNSLGGFVSLRLAMEEPERVTALCLVASVGLGREIHPLFPPLTLSGYGELAVTWGATPLGAWQRALGRSVLLFARPASAPWSWLVEQYGLGLQPGYLNATLDVLRVYVDLQGQREVLLDQLPGVPQPTLVVWGTNDQVIPTKHAHDAARSLEHGSLSLIPNCGHVPQVEQPQEFLAALRPFLRRCAAGKR